jgi:RNase H-fold protein (predicted Holliday junction resolvase)
MDTKTNLGISPGTRVIGFAVMRRGELIEWRVKTFKEIWSSDKQSSILAVVARFCKNYGVQKIAIKKIDIKRSSPQLDKLLESISNLGQQMGIKVVQYSLTDLHYNSDVNSIQTKKALSEKIAQKHPEIRLEYVRERKNRTEYYTKMFEAIGVVDGIKEANK